MGDNQRDPQQEYVEHVAEQEEGRTSPVENEDASYGDTASQPGRAAVSRRQEQASPTGAVQQSEFPVDDEKRRR
ncbi:hypothetical protein [Saccharomonospora sp.]|uniref:hypothetical protein n=1 Tax=Saccharomonospora sp. TaxID=33913 RepID=UPI00261DC6C3|nr:hypothetical protein [Saccharomonospora sp.]